MRRIISAALLFPLAFVACDESDPAGPGNTPPTAPDASITVAKNASASQLIPVVDPDGDPLTYSLVDAPDNGTVTLVAGAGGATATYTPYAGFAGSDFFVYSVSDGNASAQGRVDITVVNTSPSGLTGGSFERPAGDGTAVNVRVSATDPDGDRLTFRVTRGPIGGSVSNFATVPASADEGENVSAAVAVYTALPGFNEGDDFEVVATDGSDVIGPVTIEITVNGVPRATAASVTTQRGEPVALPLGGVDPDGDDLRFEVTRTSGSGALSATSGPLSDGAASLTFTPRADFAGNTFIEYVVRDDLDTSTPARVDITVVNARPVAENVAVETDAETPVTIELAGSDADGDSLTFAIRDAPAGGTLGEVIQTGPTTATVLYTPDSETQGDDPFTYVVNDGVEDSRLATVTVTLPSEPPAPEPAPFVALAINRGPNTLSFVDPGLGEVTATVGVGQSPSGIVVTPDASTALVTNQSSNSISVVDLASQTVTEGIAVVFSPLDIALSSDGATAYVAGGGADVDVVDVATRTVTGTISVAATGLLTDIAVSPDGTRAVVSDTDDNIRLVDLSGETVLETIFSPVGRVLDIAYAPDGSQVYVSGQFGTVVFTPLLGAVGPVTEEAGARAAGAIAFSPDGADAWITNTILPGLQVSRVDVATRTVTDVLPVGTNPLAVAVSPDGSTVYVANSADDTITVIDAETGTVVTTVPAGEGPFGLAIIPAG